MTNRGLAIAAVLFWGGCSTPAVNDGGPSGSSSGGGASASSGAGSTATSSASTGAASSSRSTTGSISSTSRTASASASSGASGGGSSGSSTGTTGMTNDAGLDDDAGQAGTPGTYAYWSWPSSVASLTDVDFFITVDVDPGPISNVFWSSQFQLNSSITGYTGMQSDFVDGGDLFLFSVWGATVADAGSPGAFCTPFTETTNGLSCRYWYPWAVGDTFKFHLEAQGNGWFAVTVTDEGNGTSFWLGSLFIPSVDSISNEQIIQWTEYFEWNDPRTTCRTVPYSSATFSLQGNGGTVVPWLAGTSPSTTCINYSDVLDAGTSVVQINGIGNSVRTQVLTPDGQCLRAQNGIIAGTPIVVHPCASPPEPNEEWVFADDGSLRVQSDYCVTVPPGATDGGIGLTLDTCVEGSPSIEWLNPGGAPNGLFSDGGELRLTGTSSCLDSNTALTSKSVPWEDLAACPQYGWGVPTRQ